ncbi:MAG: LysM peptidoglycan-binding domain-containing protein [Bacteroidales bacterium]|nr:LysM peptidoglycan-binding domain-containing protein [Bacteroidales bacterium]
MGMLPTASMFAQSTVKKSTNKVLVDRKYYYVHVVEEGHTLYSIGKAYGVSVEEIENANVNTRFGLQLGQALKIPVKDTTVIELPRKWRRKAIKHKVEPGNTLYSVSRQYQVGIDEIVTLNPDVKHGLQVGKVIEIPKQFVNTLSNDSVAVDTLQKGYTVSKGETLYSISKRFNVTIESLFGATRFLWTA